MQGGRILARAASADFLDQNVCLIAFFASDGLLGSFRTESRWLSMTAKQETVRQHFVWPFVETEDTSKKVEHLTITPINKVL